jgi:hypothetical protein
MSKEIEMIQIWVFDTSKGEFDAGFEVKLTDKEVKYLKELICQQDDSNELVHQITMKLGCYITHKSVRKDDI